MRVLVVTNMYPPHHLGGYELSCRDVVERFRERGHHVTVLTTTFRRPDSSGLTEPDADVRRELDFYWRHSRPWAPGARVVLQLESLDNLAVRRAVRHLRPDVVSLWNMGALPLSLVTTLMKSGLPIVHHTCNDWPALNLRHDALQQMLRRRPRAGRLAARALRIPTELPDVGNSGLFCWVSKATWESAERDTPWRFPHSRVVHSGISHSDFPPVDPPVNARPWTGQLLYVGRMDGLKGVETIIDAIAQVDGVRADLVGAGDEGYVDYLLQRARDAGVADRVSRTVVPRAELKSRYGAADVVLFTSLHEPFGLVPIEAMACGTPVIASGVGGSSEFLVHEVNCLLYSPGDSSGLSAAIRRLARDDTLRLALVRNGLKVAHEYTVDRLADRLEEAHLEASIGSDADGLVH